MASLEWFDNKLLEMMRVSKCRELSCFLSKHFDKKKMNKMKESQEKFIDDSLQNSGIITI